MRVTIGAAIFVLLAGCASSNPGDSRSTVSFNTSKKPGPYVLCVLSKWRESRTKPVMSEIADGYRLVIGTPEQVDDMLEVAKAGNGTSVQFYHRASWVPGLWRASSDVAVRECL